MKEKIIKYSGLLVVAAMILLGSGCRAESLASLDGEAKASREDTSIVIATDLHHLASSLKDDGQAFSKFVASGDGKLLQYTNELLEVFVDQTKAQAPDFVVLTGDLTNNGEMESHKELAGYLTEIEKDGIQVYVIPGNHDLRNPFALGFEGEKRRRVESVEPTEFAEIYEDFGYQEALSRDPNSLSYLVQPSEKVTLLMLDTNRYERNLEIGVPNPSGFVPEETLDWIEEVLAPLKETEIIAVMHHNAIPHSEMFIDNYVLDNSEEVMAVLAKYQVRIALSGHIHIQDLIQDPKTGIFDLTTSAMSVYPQQYGLLSLDQEQISYQTKALDVARHAKEKGWQDDNLLNFTAFSQEDFAERAKALMLSQLKGEFSEEQKEQMGQVMGRLNLIYFAGIEADEKEEIQSLEGYKWLRQMDNPFLQHYIDSILLDETNDNDLVIERKES